MANLTVSIDDELLRRARVRALQQGSSVNALLRAYLEGYAGDEPDRIALQRILELSRRAESGSGRGGRRWVREDAYDR